MAIYIRAQFRNTQTAKENQLNGRDACKLHSHDKNMFFRNSHNKNKSSHSALLRSAVCRECVGRQIGDGCIQRPGRVGDLTESDSHYLRCPPLGNVLIFWLFTVECF
jgi:hypothetical protein